MISLDDLGFRASFAAQFTSLNRPDLVPARIAADGRGIYGLLGCRASLGELSGRLRFDLDGLTQPVVGDWVAVSDGDERAVIHHLLDRRTAMARDATDRARRDRASIMQRQIVAANVDIYFIVTSANRDLDPRRIERYLTAVWDSGASPAIVLNKVDLVDDAQSLIATIEDVALAVPIVPVSALTGAGLAELRSLLERGTTAGFVGSSGVGKSSLVNRLIGREVQQVKAIREDDARGRHTTTRRELIVLPDGGVLIDTPGMRELGMIEDSGGFDAAFADIAEIAAGCRFSDCQHETEPGCAVRDAIASGAISGERWSSYRKLQRESAAFEARQDPVLAAERRREWKVIHKSLRARSKVSGKP